MARKVKRYRKLERLNNYDAAIVSFCMPLRDKLKVYKDNDNYILHGKYKMFLTNALKHLSIVIDEIQGKRKKISNTQRERAKKFATKTFANVLNNNSSEKQINYKELGEKEANLLTIIDIFTTALEKYIKLYNDRILEGTRKPATTAMKWSRNFLDGIAEIMGDVK